ncbi:hypothetical protein JCM24511_05143 [Saitozyma sp. JCM 24511]|nr:hypothetical protein JCM24511_05143 [Saitozyma sp. JCM 24511]
MAVSGAADLLSGMSGLDTTSHPESGPSTNRLKRRLGEPRQPAPPRDARPRLVDRLTDTRLPMVIGGSADRPIDLTLYDDDDDGGDKDDNEEACSSPSTATSTSSSCSSSALPPPCHTDDNNHDSDNETTPPSPPILTPDELETILFAAKALREAKSREIIHSLPPRPLSGRLVHPLPARPAPVKTRHRNQRRRRRPIPSPPTDDDEHDDDSEEEWRRASPFIVGGGIILDDSEMPGFDLERTMPVVPAESSCDDPVPAGDSSVEQGRADVPAQDASSRAEAFAFDKGTDQRRTDVASTDERSGPPPDDVEAFLAALEVVVSGTHT